MKIHESDPNFLLEKTLLGVKGAKTKTSASPSGVSSPYSGDRVNISEKARTFQRLSLMASSSTDVSTVRTDRIEEIMQRVESGNYEPDASKSAEKLLRSTILDQLL